MARHQQTLRIVRHGATRALYAVVYEGAAEPVSIVALSLQLAPVEAEAIVHAGYLLPAKADHPQAVAWARAQPWEDVTSIFSRLLGPRG